MRNGKSYLSKSLDDAQLVRVDFQKVNPLLIYSKSILSPTFSTSSQIDFVGFIALALKKGDADTSFAKFYARRVGQTPNTANVQIYLRDQNGTPANSLQQLVYNNWKVESTPCGTYLIIRPSDAISKIAKGEGTIVYLIEKGGDPLQPSTTQTVKDVNLYDMELVYYEANRIQPYLQPIYVATGEVVLRMEPEVILQSTSQL